MTLKPSSNSQNGYLCVFIYLYIYIHIYIYIPFKGALSISDPGVLGAFGKRGRTPGPRAQQWPQLIGPGRVNLPKLISPRGSRYLFVSIDPISANTKHPQPPNIVPICTYTSIYIYSIYTYMYIQVHLHTGYLLLRGWGCLVLG